MPSASALGIIIGFYLSNETQNQKKKKKCPPRRPYIDIADRHEKMYDRSRLYASAQGRHKIVCSFAFLMYFLWHFNEKEKLAELIFRSSRSVFCKNQENGAGKQWSLHAILNADALFLKIHPEMKKKIRHLGKLTLLVLVDASRSLHLLILRQLEMPRKDARWNEENSSFQLAEKKKKRLS